MNLSQRELNQASSILRELLDNIDSRAIPSYKCGSKMKTKKRSTVKSAGGNKIHIKPENKGKFTDYCGGKVTSECISRGKNSPSATIRKRATFAANARKWNK